MKLLRKGGTMFYRRYFAVFAALIFCLFINPLSGETPDHASIEGIPWIPQTWNNCGPANLAMVMQYWGISVSQQDIADDIRPHVKDPHADIQDMADFAVGRGLEAKIVRNTRLADLKVLISTGYPVIVPTWHIDGDGQEMGHYRTVYAYNDSASVLYLRDSLDGPEIAMDYGSFDFLWSIYNRPLLIVVPGKLSVIPESSESGLDLLPGIGSSDLEGLSELRAAALVDFSRAVVASEAGRYEEAVILLEKARPNLPWRIWWYQPRVLEAYRKTGRNRTEIDIILGCLNPYPYSEELYYLLALAYDGLGEADAAAEALQQSLELRPDWLSTTDLAEFSTDP